MSLRAYYFIKKLITSSLLLFIFTGQYSGQVRPPRGGGINQLSWKIGEENSSSPPKNFIWQWKISPISHISSLLLLNSSQFNSFCNFWEGKTQNFWRYAPILVQIDMSSSPSPHARAKNWGRKHVPSTVGVGKETGSVARILTSEGNKVNVLHNHYDGMMVWNNLINAEFC